MVKWKNGSILFSILSLSGGTAFAQGIGGAVLPADPDRFRSEVDAGFIFPEFARFKFGDVRNEFPSAGGQVIEQVFDQRHYKASYYAGARETVRLPWHLCGGPLELSGRFGIYDARRHSSFKENSADPEIYVPYIDGVIRSGLTGGAVVGMFANSEFSLSRSLFSWEVEAGLRAKYCCRGWALMPGLFFTYQRMQQKDFIDTTGSTDPTRMYLMTHINSDHYELGINFRFTRPLFSKVSWLGCISAGGEYVDGHYSGEQRFAGSVFTLAPRQWAFASDHDDKWGVSVGAETGLRLYCSGKMSISVLGNFRYINLMPYVKYPVPVINTQTVTGPARMHFQDQFTFGGELNVSAIF